MTMWTKVQIIADTGAGLGIVLTLFYSIWSFRTTLRDSYYAELDRVYFDLLQIGLEHPDLLDFPASPDPSNARRYDAYASWSGTSWRPCMTAARGGGNDACARP